MQRRQPQFASGSWHAANPIPASMERRSRRWKSGEDAKSQLKDILEEVSQNHDWPRAASSSCSAIVVVAFASEQRAIEFERP